MSAVASVGRLGRALGVTQLGGADELTDGVVHDINNLLAAILNYVSLVSDDIVKEIELRPPDELALLHEMLSDVRGIGTAAERAARLTNELLGGMPDPATSDGPSRSEGFGPGDHDTPQDRP